MNKKRLNKSDRERIVSALMKHRFDPVVEDHKKQSKEVHRLAYEKALSRLSNEQLALLNSCPQEWFGFTEFNVSGPNIYQCFFFRGNQGKPLPADTPRVTKLESNDPLYKAMLALERAEDELEKTRESHSQTLRASLSTIRTWQHLYEAWPEVVEVLEKAEVGPITALALPAVRTEELNKMFKLP